MNITYNIIDGIVYKTIVYPSGAIAINAFGSEYNFVVMGEEVEIQKFVGDRYETLEVIETPKDTQGDIDYDAINSRIAYWRSQGSAE